MKKRSAMLLAAGLVASLLSGAAALSFSLSGVRPAAADGRASKPIVRTVRETVTIHKQAKGSDTPRVVTIAGPSSTSPGSDDDATEHGSAFDDEDEDEHEEEQEAEDELEHEAEDD